MNHQEFIMMKFDIALTREKCSKFYTLLASQHNLIEDIDLKVTLRSMMRTIDGYLSFATPNSFKCSQSDDTKV